MMTWLFEGAYREQRTTETDERHSSITHALALGTLSFFVITVEQLATYMLSYVIGAW